MSDLNQPEVSRAPRQDEILAAAAALFFERGYAATSIDAIIKRAGGSKRNIYSAFGNKEGLFIALMLETAKDVLSSLEVDRAQPRDLREALLAYGLHVLDIYTGPALVGIYRTVIAESGRFPDLARRFFEEGPAQATAGLAQVLDAARDSGELPENIVHTKILAEQFVAMMRNNVHLEVVLGLRPPPSAAEIRHYVEACVDTFLIGISANRRL